MSSHILLFCLPPFFSWDCNNIIIGNCLGLFMGNQYSITVSDETNEILQRMKKGGYKMSQVIDAAVSTIGEHGCARLVAMRRRIKSIDEGDEWCCSSKKPMFTNSRRCIATNQIVVIGEHLTITACKEAKCYACSRSMDNMHVRVALRTHSTTSRIG